MRLAHTRRGHGPPLVLLHGIGMRRGVWDPVIGRLGRQRTVIAVDIPGFGASPPLPGHRSPTVRALAEALVAGLADLGVESAHVAGNSLGGALALDLGAQGWARSVIAVSPIGFYTRAELAYLRGLLRISRTVAERLGTRVDRTVKSAAFRATMFSLLYRHPSRIDSFTALADIRAVREAPAFEAAREVAIGWRPPRPDRIDAPVTIAWGRHDRLLPYRQAARARVAFPQARHITLDGCGHVPMRDDPELVAQTLLDGSGAG